MYVLGINSYSHDAGACIIHHNGEGLEIVAIAEARLSRVKRSMNFPLLSIRYFLDFFSLKSVSEVDLICGVKYKARYENDDEMLTNAWLDRAVAGDFREDADFAINYQLNNRFFRGRENLQWSHHIDAHAASAYFV